MFDDIKNDNKDGNISPKLAAGGSKETFTKKEKKHGGEALRASAVGGGEKKGVEDIFSETEQREGARSEKPAALRPKEEKMPAGVVKAVSRPGGGRIKKTVILISAVVVAAALLGAGTAYGYRYFFSRIIGDKNINNRNGEQTQAGSENAPVKTEKTKQKNVNQAVREEPVVSPAPPISPSDNTPLDSDQDGLTDEEEAALGTDPHNIDSDGDGLFDREEVKVYKTDPLNPDSDGDGYQDGAEVRDGYNPKGAGRLFGGAGSKQPN